VRYCIRELVLGEAVVTEEPQDLSNLIGFNIRDPLDMVADLADIDGCAPWIQGNDKRNAGHSPKAPKKALDVLRIKVAARPVRILDEQQQAHVGCSENRREFPKLLLPVTPRPNPVEELAQDTCGFSGD
jgi:hypothetical protein